VFSVSADLSVASKGLDAGGLRLKTAKHGACPQLHILKDLALDLHTSQHPNVPSGPTYSCKRLRGMELRVGKGYDFIGFREQSDQAGISAQVLKRSFDGRWRESWEAQRSARMELGKHANDNTRVSIDKMKSSEW